MRRLGLLLFATILAFAFQAAEQDRFPFSAPTPAFADPTPSGALPTTVINGDFSGVGLGEVGTPPTNYDFETAGGSVGTPPSNYDFETGDFTGWSLTGSPSVQSGGPTGYYAKLLSGQRVLSSAFTVDSSAQSLTFDVAAVNSGTFQWQLNIYSGATYSTKTSKYFTSCPTTCINWNSYSTDAVAWQGQSIKVEIQRYLGDLKVDNVVVEQEILVSWSPTAGDKVSRQTGGPTDAYAKTSTTIISQPYTVDSEGQNGTVDLKVESASGSYTIYVLSGSGYGTSTNVFSGTQADSSSWGTKTFGIGDFAGQSIKFKVVPASNTTVSVDRAAVSRNEVPGWAAAGTGATKALGNDFGVGYLANVLDAFSSPLTLDYSSYKGGYRVNWFRVVYRMYSNLNGQQNDVGSMLNVYFADSVSPFWGATGRSSGPPYDPTGVWLESYFSVYNPSSPFSPVPQTGRLEIRGWPPPGTLNWKSPDVMLIQRVDGPGQDKVCFNLSPGPWKRVGFCSPDPVDLASGNFSHSHTDIAIPGLSMPLEFTRTYSAQASTNGVGTVGPLGAKWSHNWQASLSEINSGNQAVVQLPGGAYQTWNKVSGTFVPPTGFEGSLVKNGDGTWTLTTKSKLVYTFSSAGKLTSLADRNANTTTLDYDQDGRLSTIADPGGRSLTLTYNDDDRISSVSDDLDRTVGFDYDDNGDLTTVTDVGTGTVTYEYSGHLLTEATDANGHTFVRNTYDSQARVTEQLDANGGLTTFAYSAPDDGATQMTDQRDNVTTYYFDASMRVTSVMDDAGSITTYAYDSDNNLTSVTDDLNHTWDYTYDSSGNLLTSTDPLDNTSTYTYNSNNDPLTLTDPLDRVTTWTYDQDGNLTETAREDDQGAPVRLTCFTRDDDGLVTELIESSTLTDCTGNTTEYGYDSYGNRTEIVSPRFSGQQEPPKTTFTYDLAGRVLTATNELDETTTYTYDAQNNLLAVEDALGNTASNTYNAKGNLETVTDANRQAVGDPEAGADCGDAGTGNGDDDDSDTVVDDGCPSYTYSYDDADHLIEVVDALGSSTTYGYDEAGNRISVTNANRQAVGDAESVGCGDPGTGNGDDDDSDTVVDDGCPSAIYAYDGLNRVVSTTDALGRTTSYAYDGVGNLVGRTDARGLATAYTYDELNRLALVEHFDGQTLVDDIDYTYDQVGSRLTMVDDTGTTAYVHDALNRLTSVTFPGYRTVSYEYDAVGNRTKLVYPDSTEVDYTYNEAHNLETVTDWLDNTTTYTYNDAGRLTDTAFPNGVDTAYSHDGAGRLQSVVNTDPGQATISSFEYTLGAAGNRTEMEDLDGINSYEYDPLYRLTEVTYPNQTTDTYTYDTIGNRLTKNTDDYTYNAADQLTDLEGVSFDYDDNGNQTSRGSDTFAYDHENRLTESVINSTTSSSVYNGDGLRMSHTVGETTTDYVWDVAAGLPAVLQDGTNTYVYGLDLISATDDQGSQSYFTYDGLGSVADVTDGDGDVVGAYAYDVFGAIRAQTGGGSNYWLFTGEQRDSDSSLYFLRARYYDPATGRFLAQDPLLGSLGDPKTQNRYSYVVGNPVNRTDPSGLIVAGDSGGSRRRDKEGLKWYIPEPPVVECDLSGCWIWPWSPPCEARTCWDQPPIFVPSDGCDFLECVLGADVAQWLEDNAQSILYGAASFADCWVAAHSIGLPALLFAYGASEGAAELAVDVACAIYGGYSGVTPPAPSHG